MEKYTILGRVGEGAHGIVLEARQKKSHRHVALKKIMFKRLEDGIPIPVFREIKALQELQHENIISLRDVFPHSAGLVLVFDFMISDLSELIRDFESPLTLPQIKSCMQQLLYGLAHMHKLHIMHRDLKPANLLINELGTLKIADLGQARLFVVDDTKHKAQTSAGKDGKKKKQSKSPKKSPKLPPRLYSHQVATRWYRAPELLYGSRQYSQAVDMWAVGCILGEMLNCSPVFPGENDIEQLVCVFRLLGSPSEQDWPGMTQLPDYAKISFPNYPATPFADIFPNASQHAVELASRLLVYDASTRPTPEDALVHAFFMSFPLPAQPHELPRPKQRALKTPVNLKYDAAQDIEQSLGAIEL